MNVENPRLRLLLGNQWQLLVAVLVVVALAGFAGAATTYQDQPTESRTLDVNQQTVATSASHQATVVRDDSLWPAGTVLEDKPVYLLNASPVVETSATTRVQGADDARVQHTWRLTISVTAGGEEFYSESQVLEETTKRGTEVTTSTRIDVSEVAQRAGNVSQKAEGAGVLSVQLSLDVDYRTDPGADGYTGNESYAAPLQIQGTTYAIAGGLGGETSHSSTQTTQVPQPPDWGAIAGMGLAGLVAMALVGVVAAIDPRTIDVDRARVDLHRTRYEEWISPGVIPMGISQQFVELETIEDVVDVAIDTNERVVFDRRRDLYAVISENLVYYFSTGGSWMESAFGQMNMPGDDSGPDQDGPFRGEDTPFAGGPAGPTQGDDEPFGYPEDEESPFGEDGREASRGDGPSLDDGGDEFDGSRESPFGGSSDGGGPGPFDDEDDEE